MKIINLKKVGLDKAIHEAVEILQRDGVVIFPSDTVYGLAVNAQSEKAVEKLFHIKDRPQGKAISIAVQDIQTMDKYVFLENKHALVLNALLPGPFTIVLPSKHVVAKSIEAEDGTLGVRFPKNKFMNTLSRVLTFPYTATSANITGKGPHYLIDAFLKTLSKKKLNLIDLIIDDGKLRHNPPSTVLNLQKDTVSIIRKGSYSIRVYKKYYSKSPDDTKRIAKEIITEQSHQKPVVLLLSGNLGVGKTVFTQGIGEYLGISERIISPTYVLYYEYITTRTQFKKLHHFDLYRSQTDEDLTVLGIEKHLQPGNMLVIEWGEKTGGIENTIRESDAEVLLVTITEVGENNRSIIVYSVS